jgi:hypothetical protein
MAGNPPAKDGGGSQGFFALLGRLSWHGVGHYILAIVLLIIFLVTAVFALVASRDPTKWAGTKEALNILLPIETGFLGTVVGYFFGAKNVAVNSN